MTLIVEHPPGWAKERQYILDVMFREFLGLPFHTQIADRDDIRITLSGDEDHSLSVADVMFAFPEEQRLKPSTLPSLPLTWHPMDACDWVQRIPHTHIPAIYDTGLDRPWCRSSDGHVTLDIDVFGSAFFLLSRYEEVVLAETDAHGRFPYKASILADGEVISRPLVNEYLEVFWATLHHLWPNLTRKQRSYRVLLSHDVDSPMTTLGIPWTQVAKASAVDILRDKNLRLASRRLFSRAAVQAGHFSRDMGYTFDTLMNIAEARGIRSAFYFICGSTDPSRDGRYELGHPQIQELIRTIHRRGHEIGLHPSYSSYLDQQEIASEFEALRMACDGLNITQERWGGRQHYLRWKAPDTWQHWADAGLDYDSTLSFADRAGFRTGTCYEYPAFNVKTRRTLRVRERPLIVMDITLFRALSSEYMNLSDRQGLDVVHYLVQTCRLYDGDFTLLWHNDRAVTHRTLSLFAESVGIATSQ